MIKISHRGNVSGSKPELENYPDYLEYAIHLGFDIECDIRVLDDQVYLGHDHGQYKISHDFINKIKNNTWFHCKNIEALYMFTQNYYNEKYFWHQNDDYTLTSNGYIWTYPDKITTNKSIIVDLNLTNKYENVYGICTDYPSML